MARCVHCGADAPLPAGGDPLCAACRNHAAAEQNRRERLGAIASTSQYDLLDLLVSDIERGLSCVENAKQASDDGQRLANIGKARESLEQVRLFTPRVRDPEQRKTVESRTQDLANAIASLQG